MNNIQLNIVANAQFQQVYAEVAKLKEAMLSLQKASVGGPFTPANVSSIRQAQTAFDNAVLSTRAFNIESVAMTSNVEKFGKQLSAGQLTINQYYKIWRDASKGVSSELDNLATTQARLNRSIAIADPLRPGYAKLVTDINGVVTAQEKAIFYQQALNTALNQGATKLIDFGKNMQWAGRQMTVGLTVPLGLFASQAAKTYLDFDQQMTSMLKVYGAHAVVQSQQTLDTIRKEVTTLATQLAHTIGVTVTDTVEIAKTFSQIGLEGQDLIKTTQATATLMKLGDLQANQAAQSMVALQNVFKLQSSQMQDAVNFLNAAKHSTSTSMQDIIDAIPRVGPILQQMGGTYKDFVTLLVGMRESGIPAAQAANAIKSMFASIENPTTRAVNTFNQLGINLKGIVAQDASNPLKMITDLQHALDKLPSLQRQQAIENLFGKFQFARVEALLNNLGKTGSQTQKVLELYGQSTDQLAAVAKQEIQVASDKTPAAQYAKMKASLAADLLPLGQQFLQVMTKLGNIVDGIVKGFNHLGAAGKVLLGALAFVGVMGPVIMLTGLLSNLAGQIFKGYNYIRMFKDGMDNATPSQNKFIAGIHNLTNFYQDLDKSTIAARNQMDLMPEAITSNAQAFEILRKAIADLTGQFEALILAQKEAMGVGLLGAAESAFKIPFRAPGMATGGFVPGNPSRGDVVPAMLTGKEYVVPYPQSVKYSSFLDNITKNNLPGFADGKKPELKYSAPTQIGIQTKKMSWSTLEAEKQAAEAAARPIVEAEVAKEVEKGKIAAEKASATIEKRIRNLTSVQASHISQEKEYKVIPSTGQKVQIKDWSAAGLMPDLGAVNNYVENLRKETDARKTTPKIIDQYEQYLTAAGKEVPVEELKKFRQGLPPLTEKQAQVLKDLAEYDYQIRGGYQSAAAKAVLQTRQTGTYYSEIHTPALQYDPAKDVAVASAVEKNVNKYISNVEKSLVEGTAAAARSASPSQEMYKEGENLALGAIQGIKSQQSALKAEGAALAGAAQIGMAENLAAAGQTWIPKNIVGETERQVEKSGIFSKFGKMFSGKLGGGLGLIGAQIGLSMVPNQIGGVNVSGVKTVGSDIATGAMLGNFLGPIGTAVGALSGAAMGLNSWFNSRQLSAERKGSEAASSAATSEQKRVAAAGGSYTKQLSAEISSFAKSTKGNIFTTPGEGAWGMTQPIAHTYENATAAGKAYLDFMNNFIVKVHQGALSGNDYKAMIDALSRSSMNGKGSALQLKAAIEQAAKANPELNDYLKIATQSLGDLSKVTGTDLINALTKVKNFIPAIAGGTNGYTGPNIPGISDTTDYAKIYKPTIKAYEALNKIMTAQANAQKKYNDQLKLTNDYLSKQNSYLEQSKQAFASGDYLAAAQIRQSAQYARSDYIGQMRQNKLSDQQQQMQDILDALNSGVSNQTPLGATLSSISKLLGYNVGTTPSSSFIKSMTGYSTENQAIASAAKLSAKGSALTQSAIKSASAGVYAGAQIVNNFDFSNSLVTDPQALIDHVSSAAASSVHAAAKKDNTKGLGGHKVVPATKSQNRLSTINRSPRP